MSCKGVGVLALAQDAVSSRTSNLTTKAKRERNRRESASGQPANTKAEVGGKSKRTKARVYR